MPIRATCPPSRASSRPRQHAGSAHDHVADAGLRAGDADRSATADALGRALSTGHLDVSDYDTRLSQAFTARSHGDLTALTAYLPVIALRDPLDRARRQHQARLGLAVHAGAALLAIAVCWFVWGAIAIAHHPTYVWPVWPTLGTAAGVLSHAALLRLGPALEALTSCRQR